MTIQLIIGLRNPGASYEHTRHNAGEWFLKALAHQHQAEFKPEKKLHCDMCQAHLALHPCKLMLPHTFMNLSGQPTREVSQFYRIEPQHILVVHDDLDIPVGATRLKTGGGHGGHNGLRDIITQLGSTHFHRLRIGIGHPGHQRLVHDYVLSKPSLKERHAIEEGIQKALNIMPVLMKDGMAAAMNQLHREER